MDKYSLKNILLDQKIELAEALKNDPPVSREAELFLKKLMTSKLIKVVTGIRRCGKSTLCILNQNLAQIAYVNFDDERLQNLKSHDLNDVYQTLLEITPKPMLFLFDEIQNIQGWELFLSRLNKKKLNILITGSNGKLLSKDLATHLTGRSLSLELFPFSLREYLHFNQADLNTNNFSIETKAQVMRLTEQYLKWGGFPDVLLGEIPGLYLRELFDRIVSRDILQRYSIKNPKSLKELGLYLIQNSGNLISYQNLAKTFEFKSVHTLKTYLNYLLESYLLLEVQHYSNKTKERLTLPRKIYTIDTGLQRALSLRPQSEIGASLETAVFLALRRHHHDIFYSRSKNHEIDFICYQLGSPTHLYQSCWSLKDPKTYTREVEAIIYFANTLKVKLLTIITWDEERTIKVENKTIQVIPFWKFAGANVPINLED